LGAGDSTPSAASTRAALAASGWGGALDQSILQLQQGVSALKFASPPTAPVLNAAVGVRVTPCCSNSHVFQEIEEFVKLLSLLPFMHNVAICGSCALWFYAAKLANGAAPNWMPGDCDLCT